MKRPVPLEVFSLSFIDLFSCAFGGMILLLVLFSIEQQGDTGEPLVGTVEISVFGLVDSGIIGELSVGVCSASSHPILLRQSGGSRRTLHGWAFESSGSPLEIRLVTKGSKSNQPSVKCSSVPIALAQVVTAYSQRLDQRGVVDRSAVLDALRNGMKAAWIARNGEDDASALRDAVVRESEVADKYLRELSVRDDQVDFLTERLGMLFRLQIVLSRSNSKDAAARVRAAIDTSIAGIVLLEQQTRIDMPSTAQNLVNRKDDPYADLLPIDEGGKSQAPVMRVSFDDGDTYMHCIIPVSSLVRVGGVTFSQEHDNASTP